MFVASPQCFVASPRIFRLRSDVPWKAPVFTGSPNDRNLGIYLC